MIQQVPNNRSTGKGGKLMDVNIPLWSVMALYITCVGVTTDRVLLLMNHSSVSDVYLDKEADIE